LALQEFGVGGLYVLDMDYMALDRLDNEDISTTYFSLSDTKGLEEG
jgi:hypothetical protein